MFGFAYRNMAFASAQLNARITASVPNMDSPVPSDVKDKSDNGWTQTLVGLAVREHCRGLLPPERLVASRRSCIGQGALMLALGSDCPGCKP
jgi:hypothetical protein